MKSFRKFIGALVCAVILVTTVFSMVSFAVDKHCTVTYKVSDNVMNLVTKKIQTEDWTVGEESVYPKGYTAEEVTGYEFIGWVVIVNEEEDENLPNGWTFEGLTLSFNKDADNVKPDSYTFVAKYIEIKPGPELDSESEETEKIVLTNDKKDSPSVIKENKIDKTSVSVEDETLEVAKTGDTNNSFVWILIGALALVAVIAVVIFMLKGKK